MDERLLNWCKRLIGCPSVTGDGTRAIVELVARDLLAPAEIQCRVLASTTEGPEQLNLLAHVKGTDSSAAPLVLNTHLDTVPAGDTALWTACGGDPFNATTMDDRIYGLGAADTKLDFVAKALALISVQPRRDVTLIATFGEEHGLAGARELAAAGELRRDALAFIGEPSRLEVIAAHKGLIVFVLRIGFEAGAPVRCSGARLRFLGRTAHSSTPALGQNAIGMALDAISAAPTLEILSIDGGDAVNKVPARCELRVTGDAPPDLAANAVSTGEMDATPIPRAAFDALRRFIIELQSFADRAGALEPDYAAPTLTCNPGIIKSDASGIELEFELRPSPGLALDTVREGITTLIAVVRNSWPHLRFALQERRANPGFRAQLDGPTIELAMAALAQAGLPLKINVKTGCTEAGVYAAAGLHPVVFGPGPSTGVIHAPNEYNFFEDVEGAAAFYRNLLQL